MLKKEQLCIELHNQNLSLEEIAKRLDISMVTLIRWRKRLGLTKHERLTKIQKEEVVRLIKDRKSKKEIAKITGLGTTSVLNIAREYGLHFNSKNRIKGNESIVIDEYKRGKSMKEIAETFKWNEATVRAILRNNNVTRPRQIIRNKNLESVKKLYEENLTVNEMYVRLNLHKDTIRSCLRELGYEEIENRTFTIDVSKLEPLSYFENMNIFDIEESNRKDFIERLILRLMYDTNSYVFVSDILGRCHITTYQLKKYEISIPNINAKYGLIANQSKFERSIQDYLVWRNINFESQKTFDDCLSPKGFKLRFDFYLPDYQIMIEADGTQHYDKTNNYYSEYLIKRDSIKDKYCESHNIKMIRIPYSQYANKQYIEDHIDEYLVFDKINQISWTQGNSLKDNPDPIKWSNDYS